MKILQIIPRFPWPLKDGGALGYFNFIKGYHDHGAELTVAALNTSKHFVEYEKLPESIKNLADIHLFEIDNHIKPFDALLNLFSNKSYHLQRFESKGFEELLRSVCRSNKFDIVIFESIFVAPYLDVIRSCSGAKCILRQHNVEYRVWQTLANIETNLLKKWYLNLLAKRLRKYELSKLNAFDGISTVTKVDADHFNKKGCTAKIHVSPFAIDLEQLQINDNTNKELDLFHIASMDWRPNQEAANWFIDNVWNKMVNKHPSLKFFIAGRNMNEEFKNRKEKNLVIAGEIEDAHTFIKEHGIMIVPLFSGSGIRVKILEGMALGKCIISTPLGAQGIDCTDGKNILLAADAEGFIQKIEYLIANPHKVEEIGKNARLLAEQVYDIKKVVNEAIGFYSSLN